MLSAARSLQRGASLVEVMIGVAIASIVLSLGVPAFSIFLQNTQIRNAAEIALSGLNIARAEAVRRNASVRFQLMSSLDNGCAPSSTSLTWVVSLADATGLCGEAPSETDAPQTVQKQSGSEGMSNVTLTTTGGNLIVFNGLGRLAAAGITQLDFSNVAGTCEHIDAGTGTMRCMRVLVTSGGQAKLCDPKVTSATDPRFCA